MRIHPLQFKRPPYESGVIITSGACPGPGFIKVREIKSMNDWFDGCIIWSKPTTEDQPCSPGES